MQANNQTQNTNCQSKGIPTVNKKQITIIIKEVDPVVTMRAKTGPYSLFDSIIKPGETDRWVTHKSYEELKKLGVGEHVV